MDGPGRWNDKIRAKLAPLARTGEARAYLERWRGAQRRLAEVPPDSSTHAALETEIEALRQRYLAAVRAEASPHVHPTSGLDRADGAA